MLDFLVLGLLARTTFRAFCWSADTKSISVSDMITSESAGPESSRVWSSRSRRTQAVISVLLAPMCNIGNFCHYRLNKYPPPPPPPRDRATELVRGCFCVQPAAVSGCVSAGGSRLGVARCSLTVPIALQRMVGLIRDPGPRLRHEWVYACLPEPASVHPQGLVVQ